MQKNIVGALLTAKYVMNHDTRFERIFVGVNVNGYLFNNSWTVKYLDDSRKRDIVQAISAIGKDRDVLMFTVSHGDGTMDLGFATCP